MNLLDLAIRIGINPVYVAGTQGGEYHSPCPSCSGKDRFRIQPFRKMTKCTGFYKCRKCDKSGDAIQFCRDFLADMAIKKRIEDNEQPFFELFQLICFKTQVLELRSSTPLTG